MKITLMLLIFILNLVVSGQAPIFLSNFEDQNTDPEIGRVRIEYGTSGNMYTVPNPHSDNRNSSNYVLKVNTAPGTGARAEYTASRYKTNNKKIIYTWKRFHPTGMFTDIEITGWCLLNQWKTWPCEFYGSGQYDFSDKICFGGGIFNDIRYEHPGIIDYTLRAAPDCNAVFYNLPEGIWNEFVLETYWTTTNNGYYRIWRNDTLFGYSDSIKTLFDGFLESTCDIYWSNGLYTYWSKTGEKTADSLIAYLDDIAVYDVDSGFTINSVCPDCEKAPSVPTDSNVYKINLNYSSAESNGYNNYIVSWRDDTSAVNVRNTFGQSSDIDMYLWSGVSVSGRGTLGDECFPKDVINTCISWTDTTTHAIQLKELNPSSTYTFKLFAATHYSGISKGTQIWTTPENRDTVLAANNTCNSATLTKLVSDEHGKLTINVKAIDNSVPRAYINSIEIVEYVTLSHCTTRTITVSADITNATASNNGAIAIAITGNGIEPYTYLWSNGETTQDVTELTEGTYSVKVTDSNGCTKTAAFTVHNSASIKNTAFSQEKIVTYSNSNTLYVKGNAAPSSITLYSYNGRKVKYSKNTNSLNISHLSRGVYIVFITGKDSFVTQKLIKE